MITDICYCFNAKTDHKSSDYWLPLPIHHADTTSVAVKLFGDWLSESVISACGLPASLLKKVLVFLAETHDIAKCTSNFAFRISRNDSAQRELLQNVGFSFSPKRDMNLSVFNHAEAGEAILLSLGCEPTIASVLGAHHGSPSVQSFEGEDKMLLQRADFYSKASSHLTRQVWQEIYRQALNTSGFQSPDELPVLTPQAQMLLSGLLILSDWIASNPRYFPLIDRDCDGKSIDLSVRAEIGWKRARKGMTPSWHTSPGLMVDDDFRDRFGFFPNDVQKAVCQSVLESVCPGIMILEAPMGTGKTEAALAAAELLAGSSRSGGLFFGLPTQATANGLFSRLLSWAEFHAQNGSRLSINLAHGKAEFNEEFRSLFDSDAESVGNDLSSEDGALIINQWLRGRKQALLSNFVVGTVDQILIASLKQRHLMLRHLGMAGKVCVIDECHAYDAYMSRYLDRTLTWLGAYKIPVVILSATLPSFRRAELIEAYRSGFGNIETCASDSEATIAPDSWKNNQSYPLLTWTDGKQVCQEEIPYQGRKTKIVIERKTDSKTVDRLRCFLKDGGCAGIIVNSVNRAQEWYRRLKTELPGFKLILTHARYLPADRSTKEKEILHSIGKSSTPTERDRTVIIGTQVLEQSLDIDFDILVTDLCPMDLLLQRLGRLHRHERIHPALLQDARCILLTPDRSQFDSAAEAIYGQYLLMRTQTLLNNSLTLPDDISPLVQTVYSDEPIEGLDGPEYKAAQEQHFVNLQKKQRRAEAYLLREPPIYDPKSPLPPPTMQGWLDGDIGEITDQQAEAAVRDIDPTITVLLVQITDSYSVRLLSSSAVDRNQACTDFRLDEKPDDSAAHSIAAQTITLPRAFCVAEQIDHTIREIEKLNLPFKKWQESSLLRGELFLPLDSSGSCQLCGKLLRYTTEYGLEIIKENAHE